MESLGISWTTKGVSHVWYCQSKCGISFKLYIHLRFYWRIHTQRTSILWYTQNCVICYRQKQICILTKFMCAFYLWQKKSILRLRRWLRQQTVFYARMRTCIQSSTPTWEDCSWRHMRAIPELGKLGEEDSWGFLVGSLASFSSPIVNACLKT